MNKFSYKSMGTDWEITVWDEVTDQEFSIIKDVILKMSHDFDNTYSRFIKTSLIWKIAQKSGEYEVPEDLVKMLRLYFDLYYLSDKKLNPLVGWTLSDMGYDQNYSLKPIDIIRKSPDLDRVIEIIDDNHIKTTQKILIDLGALGKGYFVDVLSVYLSNLGLKRFLVNGSGDIRYSGDEEIGAGLEHPFDKNKVIGNLKMVSGALCASGIDRRQWAGFHHIIDPLSNSSPKDILSVWVKAEEAALADGLATCLFLISPENFKEKYSFEYCILNKEMKIKKSEGFKAELY